MKKRLITSTILAALLLSGCGTKPETSQDESSNISSTLPAESSSVPIESSVVSSTLPEESSSVSVESSVISSTPPEESSDVSAAEEPLNPYYAGREYPDDELVPSDWLRVNSLTEAQLRIDEMVNSDTTAKDPEIALAALMDRNLMFYTIFPLGGAIGWDIFKIDWSSPYNSPNFENPLYPVTSEYFSDIQSFFELTYNTYERSVADELLYAKNGEPRFTDENGRMYINSSQFGGLAGYSFIARSYVEITEKTENKCSFIWHNSDAEGLNPPEDGYEFFYYEKPYTAEYIDGSWKLSNIIF